MSYCKWAHQPRTSLHQLKNEICRTEENENWGRKNGSQNWLQWIFQNTCGNANNVIVIVSAKANRRLTNQTGNFDLLIVMPWSL